MPNPAEVGYQALMFEVVRRSSVVFPEDFVAFVCDSHDQSGTAESVYRSLRAKNPVTGRLMGSLSYEDDKEYPQPQAADLLASEVRLKTEAWLSGSPEFPGFAKLRDN